ncbi:MAG: acetyl-coenzyme A synthetase N-terminal domain-containing protein, partial [Dehalococcoidales bacterium]|nr:acetyl-coenzyme A synthetase N-terminal domain-containing protein [Dehalococcoidales bacterium]
MEDKNGRVVLVAESDTPTREALASRLTKGGYQVVAVETGDQATKALGAKDFTAAFISLELSGKNSISVLKRAIKSQPGLKAIAITAAPSVDAVTEATKIGAVDYLIKPLGRDEMDRAIKEDLGQATAPAAGGKAKQADSREKEITSMMEETRVFPPPREFSDKAAVGSMAAYKGLYNWSVKDPDGFWGQLAEQLDWYKKWDSFRVYDFKDKPDVRHFVGGKINVSYNCVDRHLKTWRKNKAAIVWQGEPEEDVRILTYEQLYYQVCKFANVLKKLGVKKGDTVSVYLPMIPELAITMLACARIG